MQTTTLQRTPFTKNPYLQTGGGNNVSYHACTYKEGKFGGFSAVYSDADVITHVDLGGKDQMAMVGHAYFNDGFSKRFVELME